MRNIGMPTPNPFFRDGRRNWHGSLVSVDGTSTTDFGEEDLDKVICSGRSGGYYEGDVACVFLLKDGRYVAFETFYGPTGNGFSRDAYGGNADIHFASSFEAAARFGLTDDGRRMCEVAL
jgi:hypothetical protein